MATDTTGTGNLGAGPFGVANAAKAFEALLEPQEEANQEQEEANQGEEIEEPAELEASSEDDQEAEESPEAEDDESDEEVEETEQQFTVTIDGKDELVSLDELRLGYQRTADYTRKTQKLAEERKANEAELEAARAERAEYAELLPKLREAFQAGMGPEPNWAELRRQDPVQAAVIWQQREDQRRRLDQIRQEEDRVNRQQAEAKAKQDEELMIQQRNELLGKIPEWRDAKIAEKESEAIRSMLGTVGYAEEERVITDYRQVIVARKAMLYDQLMAAKQGLAGKKAKAPVVKPGGGVPKKANAVTKSLNQLQKSGSVKDAATVFANLL